jgi:hypothetical protein
MKHYLLSIQQPDGGVPAPEIMDPIMANVAVFNEEARSSGAWVFGGGLDLAHEARVARLRDDEVITTDGPYTEGKEHVGGLTIIQAADLDAALEWGRKLSRATTLPVEVREFQGGIDDHLPSGG